MTAPKFDSPAVTGTRGRWDTPWTWVVIAVDPGRDLDTGFRTNTVTIMLEADAFQPFHEEFYAMDFVRWE